MNEQQFNSLLSAILDIGFGRKGDSGFGTIEGLSVALAGTGLRNPIGEKLSEIADAINNHADAINNIAEAIERLKNS